MRALLLLPMLLAACAGAPAGADTSAADTDTGIPDTGDTEVEGAAAPAGGWPASSVCVNPDMYGFCVAVAAETWDRAATWTLASDAFGEATLRDEAGATRSVLAGPSWIVPWGLTARPGGGWAFSGATLSGWVAVNGDALEMPYDYNAFVVAVSAEGQVDWVHVHEGITADRVLVAARTDGSVALAGDLMTDVTLGETTLDGPAWVYDVFVGALTPDGAVAWATEPPDMGTSGDLRLGALGLGPRSEARVEGYVRGTVAIAGETVTAEPGAEVAARAEVSEAGAWLGIAPAP